MFYAFSAHRRTLTIALVLLGVSLGFTQCGWLGNVENKDKSLTDGNGIPGDVNPIIPGPNNGVKKLWLFSPTPATTNMCWPVSVVASTGGIATPVSTATTVQLVADPSITFFGTSSCAAGSQITTVLFGTGTSSQNFWIKGLQSGSFLVDALNPSGAYQSGSLQLDFTVPNDGSIPTRLVLNGPTQATSGSCLAFTASYYGANNNLAAFPSNTVMSLSSVGVGGGFFTSNQCNGTMVNSISIPANNPTGLFYYRNDSTGLKTVVATGNALSASQPVLIQAGSIAKLTIDGPSPINTGECRFFTVTARDLLDNPTVVSTTTPVNLFNTGIGNFFADGSCTNTISSVLIPMNNSSGMFFYKSDVAGSPTLSAQMGSFAPGNFLLVINNAPVSGAAKLAFVSQLGNTSAGNCHGPIKVQIQDNAGNTLLNVPQIVANLSTLGEGVFFSDANCFNSTSTTPTNTNFYFRDFKAENTVIQATDPAANLSGASMSLTVGVGPRYVLNVIGVDDPIPANLCSPLHLIYSDPYGNAVPVSSAMNARLTESYLTTAQVFSDGGCSSMLSSPAPQTWNVPFAQDAYQKLVYFKETKKGGGVWTANADNVLFPGSFFFEIQAAAAVRAALWGNPATTGTVGSCIGPFFVQLYDVFNNEAPAMTAFSVNMTGGSSAAFFADNNCTTAGASVPFSAGSDWNIFYLRGSNAGSITGTGTPSSNTVTGFTFPFTFNGTSVISRVAVIGKGSLPLRGPTDLLPSGCTQLAVRTEDSNGSPVNVSANRSFALSTLPAGALSFFSDSSCGTSSSMATISAGANESSIYVKPNAAGPVTVLATASGLASLGYDISFNAGAPVKLVLSGPSSGLAGNCEGPFTVQAKDANEVFTALANGTTISLAGAGQGGFYAQAGCSGSPANSVSVVSPAVSSSFYYKNNQVEGPLTFAISSGSLQPDSKLFSVTAGNMHHMELTGPTSGTRSVCLGPLQFSVVDALNNTILATGNREFSVEANGIDFYSNNACSSSPINRVIIPGGQQKSSNFYYRGNAPVVSSMRISLIDPPPTPPFFQDFTLTITQPPIVADIKANGSDGPVVVGYGSTVTVSYTQTGATSCTIAELGVTRSDSSYSTPLSWYKIGQTYTLTCSNGSVQVSDTVVVSIQGACANAATNTDLCTFGQVSPGKYSPFTLQSQVGAAITRRGFNYTGKANLPITRSTGGTGGGYVWTSDGVFQTEALTEICYILGYREYVSSTCHDDQRSGSYPNGKCNFHSPGDNQHQVFDVPGRRFVTGSANPKYNKTWAASVTCRGKLMCD